MRSNVIFRWIFGFCFYLWANKNKREKNSNDPIYMFEHEFERDLSKASNAAKYCCWTRSRFVLVTEHKLTAFSNEKKFWLYVRELLPAMGYLYERAISDDLSMSQCRSQNIYDMHPTVLFWGQITNISAHDRHLIIPSALWFRRVLAAHNAYCCDAASVIVPTPMQNSKHTSNSPNRWQIEQKKTIS